MKSLATAIIAGAGVVGLLQWVQIVYRLNLFFGECRGERSVNHIGDGDFMLIYVANVILLAAAVSALRVLWQRPAWRIASATVAVVNGLGWLTLFFMHRTGALVEYGEFLRHMRGEI